MLLSEKLLSEMLLSETTALGLRVIPSYPDEYGVCTYGFQKI